MQAQWKQNLGITVPLQKHGIQDVTARPKQLEYKGFAVGIWGADYMDPYFSWLFTTPDRRQWQWLVDPKYVAMLDEANRTLDQQKRYELLAKAEKYLLDNQPVIPIETFAVNLLEEAVCQGMYPNAASIYPWKFVYIERDRRSGITEFRVFRLVRQARLPVSLVVVNTRQTRTSVPQTCFASSFAAC